jgi:hypothetical protein
MAPVTLVNAGPTVSATVAMGPPTPSLIQMVSSTTNNPALTADAGDNFKFFLPNAVGAGNCLVLAITYPNGVTPTVTDNNGNTWPGSAAVSADAGSGNCVSAIYVLPNANAGVTRVNVAIGSNISPMQYTITEWNNVATVSPVNGSHGAAAVSGTALAAGSFTPGNNNANGGNLVFAYFAISNTFSSGNPTNWVTGGSFVLLDGDISWSTTQGFPKASQFFVQTISASINPGITSTGDTETYNCVAVALKAANAGTPIPSGIHVNKIIHFTGANIATNWSLLAPATGNLRVISSTTQGATAAVSDNESGTWTKKGSAACILFSPNKSANAGLKLTITGFGGQNSSVQFWDIQGAAASPFDTFAETSNLFSNVTVINDCPDITPTTTNGLVIANEALGFGPGLGFASGAPAGAVFDFVHYDSQTDSSDYDNSDCLGHVYNATTTAQTWNWSITSQANNSGACVAAAFKHG